MKYINLKFIDYIILVVFLHFVPQYSSAQISYLGTVSSQADEDAQTGSVLSVVPLGTEQAGDLLILVAQRRDSTSTYAINNSAGQTWTAESTFSGANTSGRIFWTKYNGTFSANPSISVTGSNGSSLILHVFRPSNTSTDWAIDVSQSTAVFSSIPVTITGNTVSNSSTVTLATWISQDRNQWGSLTGAGWINAGSAQYRVKNPGNNNDLSSTFAYYILFGGASSTGNVSKTETALGPDPGITSIISWYETIPATITPTPSLTPTATNSSTATSTATPTSTRTSNPTFTATATRTSTVTPTITNTNIATFTVVATATSTATPIVTPTTTITQTLTPTLTPILTLTLTPTPTSTIAIIEPAPSTDLDYDNDGILDSVEGDSDLDGDGIPNYQDLDSDGDGIFDIVEAGGLDQDNNGTADEMVDLNENGVVDIYDATINGVAIGNQDLDNDGKTDFLDNIDNRFLGCNTNDNLQSKLKLDKQIIKLRKFTNESINTVKKYRCGKFSAKQEKAFKDKAILNYNLLRSYITEIPDKNFLCPTNLNGCITKDLSNTFLNINLKSSVLRANVKKILFSKCPKNQISIKKVDGKANKTLSVIKTNISSFTNPQVVCK